MKLDSDRWKLEAVEVDDAEELFWPSSSTLYRSIDRSSHQRSLLNRRPFHFGCDHHRQLTSVLSLKQLALEAFLYQLIDLCQQKNYAENKRALKHYLKFLVPPLLRQQLLDLSMKDNRIYTLVDMNIFELLLSTTVKYVNISSVRSFFRQPFVNSLRSLGSGLENLIIHDSSWLQRRECLPSALSRMTQLRRISLRYLANDTMVAALAKHCHRLQEMDVSYSIDVTDDGIRVLCNPHHQTAVGQEKPLPPLLRRRKISAPASSSTAGCLVWFPRFVSGMRRRYSVIEHQANNNRQPEEDLSSVRWPEEDDTSITDTDGQSCINSLCRIDLTGTSVTSSAVQLVLATSPKLSVNF